MTGGHTPMYDFFDLIRCAGSLTQGIVGFCPCCSDSRCCAGAGFGWSLAEFGLYDDCSGIGLRLRCPDALEDRGGLLGVIGIVTLLPFASLPFKIGFTPRFWI